MHYLYSPCLILLIYSYGFDYNITSLLHDLSLIQYSFVSIFRLHAVTVEYITSKCSKPVNIITYIVLWNWFLNQVREKKEKRTIFSHIVFYNYLHNTLMTPCLLMWIQNYYLTLLAFSLKVLKYDKAEQLTNSLIFYITGNVFMSSSFLKDSFAGYKN